MANQRRAPAAIYQFKSSPYSSHLLLLESLPLKGDGRRVLDVGCGNGHLGRLLSARGYAVTGIESENGVDINFPDNVHLLIADLDVGGLPPLTGMFDYVLCADILEHLRDPESLLRDLRKHIAPGGTLFASLPNSGHLYFRLNVLCGRFPQHERGLFDRTHVRFFTWAGWNAVFNSAGFRITRVRATAVPVGLALPRWESSSFVRGAERLSYYLARIWKTMFAYQFVVEARGLPEGR